MTASHLRRVDEFLKMLRAALVAADALPAVLVAIPADEEQDGLHVFSVGTLDIPDQARLLAQAVRRLTLAKPYADTLIFPDGSMLPGAAQSGGKDGAE